MREIKFRAWDPASKVMYSVEAINFHGRERVTVQYNPIKGFFLDDVQLMQYVGVDDKSGVEIYEGDILEIGGYEEDRGVVLFNEDSTSYRVEYDNVMTPIGEFYQLELEVVGNIYENPDCLGGGSE
ncbi:MAG: YopX family protein [Selenomonas noxia]